MSLTTCSARRGCENLILETRRGGKSVVAKPFCDEGRGLVFV